MSVKYQTKPLLNYIDRYVALNPAEVLLVEKYFKPQFFAKGEIVLLEGEETKWIAFITEGILRAYHKVKKMEVTLHFRQENDFVGPFTKYSNRLRSPHTWQALEHTQVLLIAKEDHLQLMEHSQNYQNFIMMLLEQTLTHAHFRMESLLSLGAKERYLEFLKNNPKMTDRINQYQLATYLGVTSQSLSRLRNEEYRKKKSST